MAQVTFPIYVIRAKDSTALAISADEKEAYRFSERLAGTSVDSSFRVTLTKQGVADLVSGLMGIPLAGLTPVAKKPPPVQPLVTMTPYEVVQSIKGLTPSEREKLVVATKNMTEDKARNYVRGWLRVNTKKVY